MTNLLTCEHDHGYRAFKNVGPTTSSWSILRFFERNFRFKIDFFFKFLNALYLLFRKSDHLNQTIEIKQLEYWPEEAIDNHEKQPWVYWRNNPKTVRERSKILDKCREIIQSRQNDNHIPEWVWTDAETDSWLNRNRDKLSMEKRYLLRQILKRLRKGYLKIAELNDVDLQKSKNQNQPLPELKKALLTQNAIDKCSRSIESIYQKVEWMKSANDPVALNFVHKKLIDELPKDMLGIYLSTLIYSGGALIHGSAD